MKHVPKSRKDALFSEIKDLRISMTFIAKTIGVNPHKLYLLKGESRKMDMETYDKVYKVVRTAKDLQDV